MIRYSGREDTMNQAPFIVHIISINIPYSLENLFQLICRLQGLDSNLSEHKQACYQLIQTCLSTTHCKIIYLSNIICSPSK